MKTTDEKHILHLRYAQEDDLPLVLCFIRKLAEYEHLSDRVTASEDGLRHALFHNRYAEVIFGEENGVPIGFMLFFHNFSTFLGKPGIYLEDLFVLPEKRGMGYGAAMLTYLAKTAVERDCGRLEWSCLDWNEPSIAFYKKMGACAMSDWTGYRLEGDTLHALAEKEAD